MPKTTKKIKQSQKTKTKNKTTTKVKNKLKQSQNINITIDQSKKTNPRQPTQTKQQQPVYIPPTHSQPVYIPQQPMYYPPPFYTPPQPVPPTPTGPAIIPPIAPKAPTLSTPVRTEFTTANFDDREDDTFSVRSSLSSASILSSQSAYEKPYSKIIDITHTPYTMKTENTDFSPIIQTIDMRPVQTAMKKREVAKQQQKQEQMLQIGYSPIIDVSSSVSSSFSPGNLSLSLTPDVKNFLFRPQSAFDNELKDTNGDFFETQLKLENKPTPKIEVIKEEDEDDDEVDEEWERRKAIRQAEQRKIMEEKNKRLNEVADKSFEQIIDETFEKMLEKYLISNKINEMLKQKLQTNSQKERFRETVLKDVMEKVATNKPLKKNKISTSVLEDIIKDAIKKAELFEKAKREKEQNLMMENVFNAENAIKDEVKEGEKAEPESQIEIKNPEILFDFGSNFQEKYKKIKMLENTEGPNREAEKDVCPYCGAILSTKGNLFAHMRSVHLQKMNDKIFKDANNQNHTIGKELMTERNGKLTFPAKRIERAVANKQKLFNELNLLMTTQQKMEKAREVKKEKKNKAIKK